MTTAKVIAAWKDQANACAAVTVEGDAIFDGKPAAVEYIAATPLLDAQGQAKAAASLEAELVAIIKGRRKAQTATTEPLDMAGTVSL